MLGEIILKTYRLNSYTWIKIDNYEIWDMAIGNHYAGCRCCDVVNECENFNACLKDILKQMYEKDFKLYQDVKNEIQIKYKDMFKSIEGKNL